MKITFPALALILMAFLTSCFRGNKDTLVTPFPARDVPSAVAAVIAKERPDFVAKEAQKKVRDERTYYDIEGISQGSEIEFDILMTKKGPKIVEIQRDLKWSQVPTNVKALYAGQVSATGPARTIESKQTDGSIIYEIFVPERPAEPSYEIRVKDGKAPKLLKKRWKH